MTKEIYTVQLANARAAHIQEIHVHDITIKSGDPVFAPTWDMVTKYKSGQLSEEAYEALYKGRMAESMRRYPERWNALLEYDRLALACYCRPGNFCHRHLLKHMLISLSNRDGEELVDMGEVV